jgi:hypothetical protein
LQTLRNNVANAAKEGGFLGIGGKAVSDAEAASLAQIQAAQDPLRCVTSLIRLPRREP